MLTPARGIDPGARATDRRGVLRSIGIVATVVTVLVSCTGPMPASEGDLSTSSAALCVTDPLQYALGYEPPANGVVKAGWFNVQTDCQGLSVTACVQGRLDKLNFNRPYAQLSPVIYFPDAIAPYLITQPLNIMGIHGVTLVGQSPTGTVLKWSGSAPAACDVDCSMLWVNGSDTVTIKRMTLDGAGVASSLVRVAWVPTKDPTDPMGNRYLNFQTTETGLEDLRLKNAHFGMRAGILPSGAGDDHNTIRRVSFDHMSEAGFSAEHFNALNTNIWDSSFSFCRLGVTSNFGNFNVYNRTFLSSTEADIKNFDGEDFTLQGELLGALATVPRWQGRRALAHPEQQGQRPVTDGDRSLPPWLGGRGRQRHSDTIVSR